jgi:hypothetical protein
MNFGREMIGYNYNDVRSTLFTDDGQKAFLTVRDKVNELLDIAGAFKMDSVYRLAGDSFLGIACVDRMVELKEIREIKQEEIFGQDRVFVRK